MSTSPLVPVKSPPYADVMDDASTSLPGFVTEEILEESYGALNDRERTAVSAETGTSSEENDPNEGYLLPFNQTVAVLIPLYLLIFLAALDSTILSTLLTDIASSLNAMPYISWIATSYLFSTSIVQPLGKLSDIFGRKTSLLVCIFVFTIGCLQCATAGSVGGFVSGRFLSGFGAGLNSLSSIITSDLIPLRDRGVYQGLGNIFFCLGCAVGGTCGGWISQNWGWRAAFWCQVPIGVLSFVVIVVYFNLPILPHEVGNENVTMGEKFKKVDIGGISLIAFNLLVLIIMTSTSFDNVLFYWGLFALLVVGVYALYKVEDRHSFAIIPVELMKNRSVLGSSLANWFGSMYAFILTYYIPVYFTTVLGIPSEGVGLRLIPNIFATSLSSILSGYYMKWSGKYLRFSIIINAIGMHGIVLLLFLTRSGKTPNVFEQYTLSLLPMIAYVSMLTVTLLSLIAAVPFEFQSSVTSIQYAFRSIGSTLGTSFSSYLFTTSLSHYLTSKLTSNRPADVTDEMLQTIIHAASHDATYIRSKNAPNWATDLMIESYNISVSYTFVLALVTSVLGLLAICAIKENKLHTSVKR